MIIEAPREHYGTTPETILQAAWALCLAYRTGSSKVAFSFDVDEADYLMVPRIDGIIGPTFIRAICAVDLSQANIICRDLLDLVSEAARQAAQVASPTSEDESPSGGHDEDDFLGTKLEIRTTIAPTKSWDKLETHLSPGEGFEDSPIVIKCYLDDNHTAIEAITRGVPSYQTAMLLKQYEHFILQVTSLESKSVLSDINPLCCSEIEQL